MRVLGLAGQMGAGKDYTYDKLKAMLEPTGIKVRRLGLADGVRREASIAVITAFGWEITNSDGMGVWLKPYTAEQRALLQWWGTEYRRAQNPDYWVDYAYDYMHEHDTDNSLWVITDVRFANEAKALQDEGGHVTEIVAPKAVRADRLGITVPELDERSTHASEVIDFDTDSVVMSHDGVLLDNGLLRWLELPTHCILCKLADWHPFHNNGDTFE